MTCRGWQPPSAGRGPAPGRLSAGGDAGEGVSKEAGRVFGVGVLPGIGVDGAEGGPAFGGEGAPVQDGGEGGHGGPEEPDEGPLSQTAATLLRNM